LNFLVLQIDNVDNQGSRNIRETKRELITLVYAAIEDVTKKHSTTRLNCSFEEFSDKEENEREENGNNKNMDQLHKMTLNDFGFVEENTNVQNDGVSSISVEDFLSKMQPKISPNVIVDKSTESAEKEFTYELEETNLSEIPKTGEVKKQSTKNPEDITYEASSGSSKNGALMNLQDSSLFSEHNLKQNSQFKDRSVFDHTTKQKSLPSKENRSKKRDKSHTGSYDSGQVLLYFLYFKCFKVHELCFDVVILDLA
jgi:hypothetical protein